MKIKYTSKYLPLWKQRKSLVPEEELLIIQLEENAKFESEIFKMRKKFNIPQNGWPEEKMGNGQLGEKNKVLDEFSGKTNILKKERNYELLKLPANDDYFLLLYYCKSICHQCRIPEFYEGSVCWLILFNVMYLYPITFPPIDYTGKLPSTRMLINTSEDANNVIIIVDQKISKNQFHKWIDEEWKEGLEREINKLPKHLYTKIDSLKVYKRIAELKKLGETAEEIADKLNVEKLGTYGYESIEPMYNRYKKYLSRT